MKALDTIKIAAIIAAGFGAYFLVKKFGDKLDGVGDFVSDKVSGAYKAVTNTITDGVEFVADTAKGVAEATENAQVNAWTGLGLSVKPANTTTAERDFLTKGSMLLTDAEKRAIRALDAGNVTPDAQLKMKYDIFGELADAKSDMIGLKVDANTYKPYADLSDIFTGFKIN